MSGVQRISPNPYLWRTDIVPLYHERARLLVQTALGPLCALVSTCVIDIGQDVRPCTAHRTAGTRLDPGAEESRTPSTDTTGNSRQAGVVVRHDVVHNSELGSYSPTLLFAFRPRHASAERNFLFSGHREVASACGDRSCPVWRSAASCGDGESRGSRQVRGPTCAARSDAAKGGAAGISAGACARCNRCRGRR